MGRCALTLLLVVATTVTPARADETSARQAPLSWYGAPAAVSGAVVTGCMFVMLETEDLAAGFGCAMFTTVALFIPPSFHAGRGNTGRALLSAGLQLGGIFAAVQWVEHTREQCRDGTCDQEPAYVLLPVLAGTALDAGLLSWDRLQVRPMVSASSHGGTLGVAGRF